MRASTDYSETDLIILNINVALKLTIFCNLTNSKSNLLQENQNGKLNAFF